jgi:hypothetical protein
MFSSRQKKQKGERMGAPKRLHNKKPGGRPSGFVFFNPLYFQYSILRLVIIRFSENFFSNLFNKLSKILKKSALDKIKPLFSVHAFSQELLP